MNDFSLNQLVNFPTRNTNILDLIITSTPGLYSNIFSLDKFSDHDVIAGVLDFKLKIKGTKRKIFLYHRADVDSMKKKTVQFSKEQYFNGFQNSRSVDSNWKLLKSHLSKITHDHVPCKIAKSNLQPPWINNKIRRLVRKRNRTHAKAKKHNSSRLKKKWSNIRAQIKFETNQSHDNYVNNLIGNIKDNCKPFWRYINSKKQDKQQIPNLKKKDGSEA